MLWDFFGTSKRKKLQELLKRAELRTHQENATRLSLENQKQDLMKRQVDLWSIGTMSLATEEEYFGVSAKITKLVKHIGALDEYITDLRQQRQKCENGESGEALEALLAIADPWEEKIKSGKADAVPKVILQ